MSRRDRAGLAIGGPKAGKYIVQAGTSYYVVRKPRLKLSDLSPPEYPDATVEPLYRRGRYEFDGLEWWWRGWEG
jgi:hypothetical protein